jgi:hypothetical protein
MTAGPQPNRPSGAAEGWAVVGTLLAGMLVWGGIGWLIDLWLDTTFVKAIGVIVGTAASIYLVVVKYGK